MTGLARRAWFKYQMQVMGDVTTFTISLLTKSSVFTSSLMVESNFFLISSCGLMEYGSNRTLHFVQRHNLGFDVGFHWPLHLSL